MMSGTQPPRGLPPGGLGAVPVSGPMVPGGPGALPLPSPMSGAMVPGVPGPGLGGPMAMPGKGVLFFW